VIEILKLIEEWLITEDQKCSKCKKGKVWQKQYGLCNKCLTEFGFNNLNTLNINKDNKTKTNKTKIKGEK
jgi:hypothetical protein